MLTTILLILALVFVLISFANSAIPWLQIALLLVILALLFPKFGVS